MHYLVTGCAGFIGSTLSEMLISDGHQVTGVDAFTNYYPVKTKVSNLRELSESKAFSLVQKDVRDIGPRELHSVDAVIHLAAQPGVRDSWLDFQTYVRNNVDATQVLLQLCVDQGISRMVFASSSSIYGDQRHYPVDEGAGPSPRSPYGVTKLAGEALCLAYSENFGLETPSLRFFTVYGPRQRPDMAIQRILTAAIAGSPFTLFGDGSARRDFTYVQDVARACVLAAQRPLPRHHVPLNIGGSGDTSMRDLISLAEQVTGYPVNVRYEDGQLGDVQRTGADTSLAATILGWTPKFGMTEGLQRQADYIKNRIR